MVTGEECMHLIYNYILLLLISKSLIPTQQFTVYHPAIFVCFMSYSSCAYATPDFQKGADKSISCRNLVFLHPVFRYFVSDL